jgi:hypothetical protein
MGEREVAVKAITFNLESKFKVGHHFTWRCSHRHSQGSCLDEHHSLAKCQDMSRYSMILCRMKGYDARQTKKIS